MWSDIPNLRHLRAFATVAECGSVTLAGQRIFRSQPAITQALSSLEVRLGTKLLEFGPDGMVATKAGRLFQDRVNRAFAFIETGAREARHSQPRKAAGGFSNFEHMITVAQLRALSAMVFSRNFSLAARDLGLSQPSVHRAARDLERLSGLALFITTRQGIELTQAAESLARHAALAHAELRQGFAEVGETLGLDPGQIVVGALPLVRTKILPDAINRLSRERELARVKVISAPYDGLLGRLRYGIIDFLIGALREPPPIEDVVQEKLFDDHLAVIARADHPLTRKTGITREDLLSYPWVMPGDDTPTRGVFAQMFGPAELARMPGGMVETSSLVMLRAILSGSDRLTLLSARQALNELEDGVLACLPFTVPFGSRQIGLTFRLGWRPTATQALMLDYLRENRTEAVKI